MNRIPEPCLCGDPLCPNCFPKYEEQDPDAEYDAEVQAAIDARHQRAINREYARRVADDLIEVLKGLKP